MIDLNTLTNDIIAMINHKICINLIKSLTDPKNQVFHELDDDMDRIYFATLDVKWTELIEHFNTSIFDPVNMMLKYGIKTGDLNMVKTVVLSDGFCPSMVNNMGEDPKIIAYLTTLKEDDEILQFASEVELMIEQCALTDAAMMREGETGDKVPDDFWYIVLDKISDDMELSDEQMATNVLYRDYPISVSDLKTRFTQKVHDMYTDYSYVLYSDVTVLKCNYFARDGEEVPCICPKIILNGNFTIQDMIKAIVAEHGRTNRYIRPYTRVNGNVVTLTYEYF